MVIPIAWKQHSATVAGRVIKEVDCEDCETQYVYVAEREAKGEGSSLYFLDNQGAARRAAERAERALQKELDGACELVPCPECGWLQSDMVRESRRRHLKWLRTIAIFLTILTVVFGILNFASGINRRRSEPALLDWSTFATWALIGPGLLVLVTLLRFRHDPNDGDRQAAKQRGRERGMLRADYERMKREAASED